MGEWEGGIQTWKVHGQRMFDNDCLVDNELKKQEHDIASSLRVHMKHLYSNFPRIRVWL